ncbi:flagellar filament capping protein FliD [Helicobacter saguini]|uniref:Flagellar hook-associated protein 2 n=1 Tax=Helicobacter saguini TaxID=1548018 RepID=A0A347VQW6_9HELI|nr:flagellar filament capping protein FliD [Helicobacter saguini]MWV63130.1 flagellar filament capping protein FliD [Helicobacter saguini]MWV66200.1 flagellar filament capping protein FliD [Helicobacter saguini]MWV68549.1 flagellar filament capping protein FliD [Helicobacter saguini]MWV71896.1 flagellar filament capping protein FliD [Helicobacter saguini]TLD95910.1 flagellar filament capping protein FliD [Helicobacter saguini]
MAGKITSLGLGSSVLNSDVIDKLKKADEDNMVKPIDKKMEMNLEKQKQLVEIETAVGALRASAKKLADYSTFLSRNVSVSGDAVKATAADGIPVQSVNIEVKNLAKSDINEIGTKFASKEDAFTNEDTKLDFYSNGKNYSVDIKGGMNVAEVAQAITDATDGKIMGVVMKTGGEKPYQLMINSKETGENNRIYFGPILRGERISSSDIKLEGEKDFFIEVKDKNGATQKIGITTDLSNASDRAEALRSAIKEAINNNEATKGLVDSGDISVGLVNEGQSLIFNDKRGYKISVGGEKAGMLGFVNKEAEVKNLFDAGSEVKAGALSGTFNINDTTIDLAAITKKENTAEQNAAAIVEAMNKVDGLTASVENNKISFNANGKEVNITSTNEKNLLDLTGIKSGKYKDFATVQQNLFKLKNVQSAQDSEVLYNGASIKRPTNTLDDVVGGLTINLQKVSEEGKPDVITVSQNTDDLVKEVAEFVKAYNEAVPKLDAVTKFDADTKRGGVFSTESIIRNIRPALNQAITQSITNGTDVKSLMDYGISINDKSFMSLDSGKLASAVSADPERVKDVFYGGEKKDSSGKYNRYDGIFTKVSNVLGDLVDGGNAKLKTFSQTLERELKNYNAEREKSKKMLDARYETMAQRFASFDEQIAKANNSFNAVQMMIDQQAGEKKKN